MMATIKEWHYPEMERNTIRSCFQEMGISPEGPKLMSTLKMRTLHLGEDHEEYAISLNGKCPSPLLQN